MRALLLTLGHNSSAIMVNDHRVVWGYETERITGVKSDSSFPRAVLDMATSPKPDMVYVTHWAPDGLLSSMSAKHWDPSYFDGIPIRTIGNGMSHHDTHIHAAACYAGNMFTAKSDTYGVVIDGFGTYGEHFSIYKFEFDGPKLVKRYHGYDTSLGLWYQYSTAFMGMKMHEDEYKLLGYEVHVSEEDAVTLHFEALTIAADFIERMGKSVYKSEFDPIYNLSALTSIKERVFTVLLGVCKRVGIMDPTTFESRCKLAYLVQKVLENVVTTVLAQVPYTNLLLSGGVFYNVKLNKVLLDNVPGQLCIYPLAGDQGNAVGLYSADNLAFEFPPDLNWGLRQLHDVGHVPNLMVVDESRAADLILDMLKAVGYVNLVRGNMEFGPRAMCNTSTLALPRLDVVEAINAANDRNTVMPMAPVMTRLMYLRLFERTDHLWRSESHMITAMEFKDPPGRDMLGITHGYMWPYRHFTGRPQVVSNTDALMTQILNAVGHPLINTSFNFHGKPIPLGMDRVIENHMMQLRRNPKFFTVVIKND
jgi:predicted NodU family carbamoyl transferase